MIQYNILTLYGFLAAHTDTFLNKLYIMPYTCSTLHHGIYLQNTFKIHYITPCLVHIAILTVHSESIQTPSLFPTLLCHSLMLKSFQFIFHHLTENFLKTQSKNIFKNI